MNRRLGAILALAAVPWTVLLVGGEVELVFVWGLVNTGPTHVVSVYAYVFEFTRGLPDRLLAWPVGSVLYAVGAASAISGALAGREDRRLTAGLLALAGASHLVFTLGVGRRNPAALALPVGPALAWLVAWWFDWPALARTARGER